MLKRLVHAVGRAYIARITQSEAQGQRFQWLNERSIEFGFVARCVTELRPKSVLDVGSGTSPLPAILSGFGCIVTAIDSFGSYWPNGTFNRHWHIKRDDILECRKRGPYDLVTCISALEHIDNPVCALVSMMEALAPDGHIVVTMPYNEYRHHADVYALPGAVVNGPLPYKCRSASRKDLREWFKTAELEIVEQEYWRLWTGEVWRQGEWLDRPIRSERSQPHQLTCLLLRKNTA